MDGIPEAQMSGVAQSASPIIGIEKKCPKCREIKPVEKFSYRKKTNTPTSYCKDCTKKASILWNKANPERRRIIVGRWSKANPEKRYKLFLRWAKKYPLKRRLQEQRANKKTRSTPQGKLNNCMCRNIGKALKGNEKGRRWESLVDFKLDQLKKHLEKHFLSGMTWDNYGKWHIDHVIPTSVFNFEKPEDDDFKRCWSLQNLQPLWALDNIKKGNKLEKPFQPKLIFSKE